METNRKLKETLNDLESYKTELEERNEELISKNKILENSLKQISLMVEEREKTNKELERLNKVREENFNNLVNILSTLIESRWQSHRGHAKRVAEIAIFIAEKFELNKQQIQNIKVASLLHEIGMFGLPDDLIMKETKDYTDRERNIVKQCPIVGASLLEGYSGFEQIARFIQHSHEKVDGTGIPDNLVNEQIPIGSRIIAVAEAFDDLINRTEDNKVDSALDEIEKHVGTTYDRKVVYYLYQYAKENISEISEKLKEMQIHELKSGMVLASDIFTQNGLKLMPKNTVLNDESIDFIIRYNVNDPIEDIVFIKKG